MFNSVDNISPNLFEDQSSEDDFLHRAQNHRPILVAGHVNVRCVIGEALFHLARNRSNERADFRPESDFLVGWRSGVEGDAGAEATSREAGGW